MIKKSMPTSDEIKNFKIEDPPSQTKELPVETEGKRNILDFIKEILHESGAKNPQNIVVLFDDYFEGVINGENIKANYPVFLYDLKDLKNIVFNLELFKSTLLGKLTKIHKEDTQNETK